MVEVAERYSNIHFHGGEWQVSGERLLQADGRPGRLAEARLPLPPSASEILIDARMLTTEQRLPGAFGWLLEAGERELLVCEWLPRIGGLGATTLQLGINAGDQHQERYPALSAGFNISQPHLQAVFWGPRQAVFRLDHEQIWQGTFDLPLERLVFFSRGMSASFSVMIK